jgi:hypothetical protein
MDGPLITLRLDAPNRIFSPGETLSGEYTIEAFQPDQIRAIELSVLWFTEGKGDEDLGVHFFQRRSSEEDAAFDPRQTVRFNTRLPNSPLSYDGRIVKVRWCVRVRVFLPRGTELVEDVLFQLGCVPRPEPVEAASP